MVEELTPKQRKALELLIAGSGMTYKAICEEVGINPKTLWEWRHNPEFVMFQSEYQRLKDEQWQTTVEAARAGALKLCSTGNQKMIQFVLQNDGLNPSQKVEAKVDAMAQVVFVDDLEEDVNE